MTCREILDFLDDYLDGTLPPKVHIEFVRHLELCPACRDYLDSYRKTIQVSRVALNARLSRPMEQLPEELIRAILAARSDLGMIDEEFQE